MDSGRSAKVLFNEALERPAGERAAYLEGACGGDEALRARVQRLLEAHARGPGFLASPTGGPGGGSVGERPGDVIGRYRLLEQIGEGGFGVVFLAEQREPVARRVALKVIKLGMDTKQVIARFEAERQALAMMDHPGIARVLDGGATEAGRPYFVMELVKGEPITAWCDRHGLDIRRRLELFREVCRAVQHAHQKGIIHRDLKPSNVLVSGVDGGPSWGSPKVIDFGIAKATGGPLTDKTYFTDLRQFIGTPEYMSPEQASWGSGVDSADIDTRSDIYSLGVLLYELLAGVPPFDPRKLRSAAWEEMRRIIREQEPPRPSTRVSTLAKGGSAGLDPKNSGGADLGDVSEPPGRLNTDPAGLRPQKAGESKRRRDAKPERRAPGPPASGLQPPVSSDSPPAVGLTTVAGLRGTDAKRLCQLLHGDLDWIVMKCLDKDRSRRYETANALAADVGRHLAGEPVVAAPPSRTYRARKFVRRNRRGVAAGSLIAAALLLGMIGTSGGFLWAMREAERAEEQSAELERVLKFQASQLAGLDAAAMGIRLRRTITDRRWTTLEREGLDDAGIERALLDLDRSLTGVNFTNVALEVLDETLLQPALREIELRFVDQPLIKARLLQTVANTMREWGLYDQAKGPQEEALKIRSSILGDAHRNTVYSLTEYGLLLGRMGRYGEGTGVLRGAVATARREFGETDRATLRAINNLGVLLLSLGEYAESEQCFREVLQARRDVPGGADGFVLTALGNLGYALDAQGKAAEAEVCYRDALRQRRDAWGIDHPSTLWASQRLGIFLRGQGRLGDAEPYLREALAGYRFKLGDEHPITIHSVHQFGMLCRELGDFEAAERLGEEAVVAARRSLPPGQPGLAWYLLRHGQALAGLEQFGRAEASMLEAHAHFETANWENRGVARAFADRLAEALADLYDAWHAAEPEAGHDAKAAEWRARLEAAAEGREVAGPGVTAGGGAAGAGGGG